MDIESLKYQLVFCGVGESFIFLIQFYNNFDNDWFTSFYVNIAKAITEQILHGYYEDKMRS